ncbi:MAG: flavodoxin domain-containing protein [Paracoccaceae bacterium]
MDITVLYGTETGNAEMLAEDIQAELEAEHDIECINLADFAPSDFDPTRLHLIVCSTYGDGELPASAQPFAEVLTTSGVDLAGVYFAIFGLGDMEYEETFNGGSKTLATLLESKGARQTGTNPAHNASGPDMAEDIALPWATDVVAHAAEFYAEEG